MVIGIPSQPIDPIELRKRACSDDQPDTSAIDQHDPWPDRIDRPMRGIVRNNLADRGWSVSHLKLEAEAVARSPKSPDARIDDEALRDPDDAMRPAGSRR